MLGFEEFWVFGVFEHPWGRGGGHPGRDVKVTLGMRMWILLFCWSFGVLFVVGFF